MILTFDKIKVLPFDECKITNMSKTISYINFLIDTINVIFVIKTKYINSSKSIVSNADKILIDGVNIKKAKVIASNGRLSVVDNAENSITFDNDSFETYHSIHYGDIISRSDKIFKGEKGKFLRSLVKLLIIDLGYAYSIDLLYGIK